MLEKSLEGIGISGGLAKVYLACINLGTTSIAKIIEKTDLPKATVYDLLERLQRDGLVNISNNARNRLVTALNPSVLLERNEIQRQRLNEVLPLINALFFRAQGKPNIRFYEGVEGIKTALWDSITGDASEMLSCFSMQELAETPGLDFVEKYTQERVKRAKHLKVIRSREKDIYQIWPTSTSDLREVRYSPEGMLMAMTFVIYGNSVALMSSGKEAYGLVIDSEEYASLMRTMYTGIWLMSTPSDLVEN